MNTTITNTISWAISLAIFFAMPATADAEYSMYATGEKFYYHQSSDFPETMNRKENFGYVYGIGATIKLIMPSKITLKATSEMKGNRFDMDQYDSNDNIEILMIKAVGDFGLNFQINDRTSLEPFFGFGYRRWLRDVEEYEPYSGYTQVWRSHYINTGAEIMYVLSDTLKSFINGGAIISVSNRMKRNKDGSTCTVNFSSSASGFGEIGAVYNKIRVGIFYEGLRFPESKDACLGVKQPETKTDMLGIKLGITI